MKRIVKKIPFLGDFATKIYRKLKSKEKFTNSRNYWEKRYQSGGNSGSGSYNNLAEFKSQVINDFVERNQIDSAIEFGCGDGNQLKYLTIKNYLGVDVSEKAVQICLELFRNDSTKKFKVLSSFGNEKATLTMSLDVIYHLVEEDTFVNYMTQLFKSTNKYVIVYSSNTNDTSLNAPHVKHRKFTDWVERNQLEFKLIQHIPNIYPFNGNGEVTSCADFYIYEKKA